MERILIPEVEDNLLRIAQEALNNIVKHSGATEVWLEAHWIDPHLELVIRDNGRGLPTGNGHPVPEADGLANMHQRLRATGGDISIGKAPGGGTFVRMVVPITQRYSPSNSPN